MEEKDNLQLPENAFRELKDGEEYKPLMSPDKVYPEVNEDLNWVLEPGEFKASVGDQSVTFAL